MYAPTQEKLDSLPPLKKRLLSMIPCDKWTDPKEVAQSLAMVEGVHLSMIEVMKACHTLSKMGFMQIRETNRDQLLKRIPVKQKKESVKQGVKPMVHKKTLELVAKDVVKDIEAVESEFLNFAERISITMRKAADEIRSLRDGDSAEVIRLKEIEDKYNKMRELLK